MLSLSKHGVGFFNGLLSPRDARSLEIHTVNDFFTPRFQVVRPNGRGGISKACG